MENFNTRTELLIGKDSIKQLKTSKILLFGLGGVGGHVFDALVRIGVGNIDVVDNDTISITNLNRQTLTNRNNIGKLKTEIAKEHALSINPNITINCYNFLPLQT